MKYTGWILWTLGIAFAVLGTINAKKSSDEYLDAIFKARISINEGMKKEEISNHDLKFDLESLQKEMASQRKIGYILIASLMGFGTILIRRRERD